jgi:hypothetical protein
MDPFPRITCRQSSSWPWTRYTICKSPCIRSRVMLLIEMQDGYGPPADYYQNGPYNGLSVSEVHSLSLIKSLTPSRTTMVYSRRQPQDPHTATTLVEERLAACERLRHPVHLVGPRAAPDRKRPLGPRKPRHQRATNTRPPSSRRH